MNRKRTLKDLLAEAAAPAERKAARIAWIKEAGAAWLKAHRAMDNRLAEAVERLSEEDFERLCDAEFAKVDAMMAQLRAAVDEDKWPRELYFGGI